MSDVPRKKLPLWRQVLLWTAISLILLFLAFVTMMTLDYQRTKIL